MMSDCERRSIRWAGYDYVQGGAYFVTLCVHERKCVFGRLEGGAMVLNVYGTFVRECWLALPNHFAQVELDQFQIMPNHFHGVLFIDPP